ncbi:uncharacterized protein BJ212DRAFT_1448903 [Suillus subaureus]|uniref:C2H2-type domain-containing protein n=1 Tax=Suillus subaureus TaxID=48587 RepID=A0A9P7J922_9AGAM|nr:uncharacterized protein BJ212DRAFT_1448903 [Suillus subaureus]KAG1808945.1 hypothetical protein BJ212DRAFT_1448903 [Suillus subaureus]
MWWRASHWSLALVLFIFLLVILGYMSENDHMQIPRQQFNAFQVPCGHAGCKQYFKTTAGCTKHILSAHPIMSFPPPEDYDNGLADSDQQEGHPCDEHGNFLPDGTPPPPAEPRSCNDWTPFRNHVEFETAEFLYIQNQMPANQADCLLNLWATTLLKHGNSPPFADHCNLYATIDSIPLGGVKWQGFSCTYSDEKPDGNYPPWMDGSYDEVVCKILANPTYSDEMDYQSYHKYSTNGDEHQFQDFMSADWTWDQADIITGDPETLGSTFMPIILSSDEMTVSVATRNNEYYLLYLSIGNVHNNVQHAHQDAVAIIGFLAMPETMKEYAEDPKFHAFRHQLSHSLLSHILETLRPVMTKPEVAKFGDGHFWQVIYGLGPYIADYEEQVLLVCIPFMNNFPQADIYHLIAPNLLHQVIKGALKDHLVAWVELYIMKTHGKCNGLHILDDIDHRIAAIASFAGLHHFLQGQGFKQWMGDNSKALMKVYLAAIEGHVPQDIVCAFCTFLEFCYLVHQNTITESTLDEIEDALSCYHHYCTIFTESGTIPTFSLPCQHSLVHYAYLIRQFGAPNGLCSSITKSKHIKAVKEPWRRSSKYKALSQMLVTNQHLNKLAAACVDFANHKMLDNTCLAAELEALTLCYAERKHTHDVLALAEELELPCFPDLICWFLFEQMHRPDDDQNPAEIPLTGCPRFAGKISLFNSVSSRFYTPSDISGIRGMHVKHICACPLWQNEAPRNDCIFISTGSITRVHTFFSFKYSSENFLCTIMHWFDVIGDSPDEDTGMWMVRPAYSANCAPLHSIIHVDTIYRTAHLIPIYSRHFLPPNINLHVSYDTFCAYYVNKFINHHVFEIAS